MKRILFFTILLTFVVSGSIFPQNFTNPKTVKFLELTEEEIEKLEILQSGKELIQSEAQVELNLLKAQLEKLLFPVNSDMSAIEIKMRATHEWKLRIEMANIRLRVEARKIIGETRWRKLLQMQREIRQRNDDTRQSQSQRDNNQNRGE